MSQITSSLIHIPATVVRWHSAAASFSVPICAQIGSKWFGDKYLLFLLKKSSRYNLKRRVASLPPLSSEVFAEKVLNAQASSSAVAAHASFEKSCPACSKTYYSENAFQNHLGSQKHKLRSAILLKDGQVPTDDEAASVMSSTVSLGEPISTGPPPPAAEAQPVSIDPEAEAEFSKVVDGIKETKISEDEPLSCRPTRPYHSSTEQRPTPPLSPPKNAATTISLAEETPFGDILQKKCLFCNYDSPTFKLNMMHMTKYHSMFIPEQAYLVDLEGLVTWLYGKIQDLHECLYCHKIKGSAEATQTHMRDVGHCKIAFEAEQDMIEVGQFYDFSSTYSDPDEDDMLMQSDDEGGVEVPDNRKILKTVVSDENGDVEMANGEENAEGWETDSSASSLDTDDLTAVPIDRRHMYKKERLQMHRHHSHDDPRPHRNADGFHSHAHQHHAAFTSDHELYLPSGRTAGHRSLNRYYRQNLHNHPSPAERIEQQRLLEGARADEGGDENMVGNRADGSSERGRQVMTRANGGLGMLGVTDQKKKEVRAVEKRDTKRAQRAEKQYQWGVDKKGNNQKHFRDPLLQ